MDDMGRTDWRLIIFCTPLVGRYGGQWFLSAASLLQHTPQAIAALSYRRLTVRFMIPIFIDTVYMYVRYEENILIISTNNIFVWTNIVSRLSSSNIDL